MNWRSDERPDTRPLEREFTTADINMNQPEREQMGTTTIEQILQLERAVWSALASGDIAADARLLADDFLGVYSSGFAGKEEHTGQLQDGPTVVAYELSEARLQELSKDIVLLAYRANWVRQKGREAGEGETMYITSIWRRMDEEWKNIFSQDTRAES